MSLSEKFSRYTGEKLTPSPLFRSESNRQPFQNQQTRTPPLPIAQTSGTLGPLGHAAPPAPGLENPQTLKIFSGTLTVTRARPGIIKFKVPPNVVSPAIVNFKASGAAFNVQLLTPTQMTRFGSQRPRPEDFNISEITVTAPGPDTWSWRSPMVTSITQELGLAQAGDWYLVFNNAPELDQQNLIDVDFSLVTTKMVDLNRR